MCVEQAQLFTRACSADPLWIPQRSLLGPPGCWLGSGSPHRAAAPNKTQVVASSLLSLLLLNPKKEHLRSDLISVWYDVAWKEKRLKFQRGAFKKRKSAANLQSVFRHVLSDNMNGEDCCMKESNGRSEQVRLIDSTVTKIQQTKALLMCV